ncbi:helix-turn-helix transcriptional regulator [Prauserella cavernicola]|uniref:LuxR family transcriptional regulator n=1 Tax=Prauserella cavernicola TaxID=2800127 RepID=A0A934QZT1_9PSEU|nr:helix-turn-helix transcriptional regulator [Prauserella cavernicola]MBK1789077.1 LuxR family transcriptional regulator [Prauserella cavernicola]
MTTHTLSRVSVLRAPERVPTHAGIDAHLAAADHEVIISAPCALGTGDPIAMVRGLDHHNLRRGVRYRVLLPDRARTAPVLAARLGALALAGAEVRTMPEVPMAALVIDGELAVLPSGKGESGVALFQLPSVVNTSVELFERVWPSAVPLAAGEVPADGELGERERELLSLLSAGCTDESAAARLGISVRTVRRMVSTIMSKLGARSRFQAGVKAADRGWLELHAS